MANREETIALPKQFVKKIESSLEEVESLHEELEFILLSKNPNFLKKMRQARIEHRRGKTRSLEELKADLCIK